MKARGERASNSARVPGPGEGQCACGARGGSAGTRTKRSGDSTLAQMRIPTAEKKLIRNRPPKLGRTGSAKSRDQNDYPAHPTHPISPCRAFLGASRPPTRFPWRLRGTYEEVLARCKNNQKKGQNGVFRYVKKSPPAEKKYATRLSIRQNPYAQFLEALRCVVLTHGGGSLGGLR